MTIKINSKLMSLEVAGQTVAVARECIDGRWEIVDRPGLLDRNQVITALTVAELLEMGHDPASPVVAALRGELP